MAGMAALHITKVAVGCAGVEELRARLDGRAVADETFITTRFRPTRHAELVGGSLYWILKHQLVARSPILRFEEDERGHCLIRLRAGLVPIRTTFKRVHQGWRYFPVEYAPADLDGGADELSALPPQLAAALASLALI
jgi:hypothetical protein